MIEVFGVRSGGMSNYSTRGVVVRPIVRGSALLLASYNNRVFSRMTYICAPCATGARWYMVYK